MAHLRVEKTKNKCNRRAASSAAARAAFSAAARGFLLHPLRSRIQLDKLFSKLRLCFIHFFLMELCVAIYQVEYAKLKKGCLQCTSFLNIFQIPACERKVRDCLGVAVYIRSGKYLFFSISFLIYLRTYIYSYDTLTNETNKERTRTK